MTGRGAGAREVVFTGAAAAFVAFAVWGSLFPFEFHAVPAAEAVRLFWLPWLRGPATWSISDLVSNVLLFVPIGVFLTASASWLPPSGGSPRTGLVVVLVVTGAFLLSAALEFAQAFVPYRTPSAVDVMAETLGAALGAAAWRLRGARADAAVSAVIDAVMRAPLPCRVLLGYCLVFAVAWLLPLDFTLRPGEIADKYQHKRLLLPFAPSPDAASRIQLGLAFAAGLPLGIAAMVCGTAPGRRRALLSALRLAIPALIALEALQVTVFSRTTDTTSLLAVIAATVAGASSAR
jgi:glycopeptide antibiotics resistance protein